jgi:hypothetical protein
MRHKPKKKNQPAVGRAMDAIANSNPRCEINFGQTVALISDILHLCDKKGYAVSTVLMRAIAKHQEER